jgi:hypothetical protein
MCQKCAVLCTDLKLFLTHQNTNNDGCAIIPL